MIDPLLASVNGQSVAPERSDMIGKDAFLRLFTAQLANQDPSSPQDGSQFIAQLATFASVEKLSTIDSRLGEVVGGLAAVNASTTSNLLGRGAIARGNTLCVTVPGPYTFDYHSEQPATDATLTITDASGRVVRTVAVDALVEGDGSIAWDGRDDRGRLVPAGTYNFAISGVDATGNPFDVEERIRGVITSVDYTSGAPVPTIGGVPVAMPDILRLDLV